MNYKKSHPDFGTSHSPYLPYTDKRKQEADKIREKYADRIPVICEKSLTSKLPEIDKTKYSLCQNLISLSGISCQMTWHHTTLTISSERE